MERKNVVTVKGDPLTLIGDEIKKGQGAPDFTVLNADLREVSLKDFDGKIKLIAAVPSLDTPVCDLQIKRFNDEATQVSKDVAIIFISMDHYIQSTFIKILEMQYPGVFKLLLTLFFCFATVSMLKSQNSEQLSVTADIYSDLRVSMISQNDNTDPYVLKIGSDNTQSEAPFGFMWKYSLSQIIYPANEINVARGVLTGLQFETLINTTIYNNRITVWIGETQRQNLLLGWTDNSVLQKVFEGNVDFPAGTKKLYIPFDNNYEYKGGNLLIHVHKSADALAGNNFFIASETQESSRVLIVQRDNFPYQIFEPEEIGVSMRTIPNLTLFFSPEGLVSERELNREPVPVSDIARISAPGVTTVPTPTNDRRQPTVTPTDRVSADRTPVRSQRINVREQRNRLSLGTDASITLYDGDFLYPVLLPGFEISVGYFQNRPLSFGWNLGAGRAESTG